MRTALAIACLLLCAACGPSALERQNAEMQNQLDAQNAADIAERKQRQEHAAQVAACKTDQETKRAENSRKIIDDENLVKLALGEIDKSVSSDSAAARYLLHVEIEHLDPNEWRWSEREGAVASSEDSAGGRFDRLNYTVNPANLSQTVEVSSAGLPTIKISCLTGNCIRVIGSRTYFDQYGDGKKGDIDESRSDNSWVLDTQAKASALAATMTDMLTRINALKTEVDCESAGAAAGNAMPAGNAM